MHESAVLNGISRSVWDDSWPCLNEIRPHGWRESADRMVFRGPLWPAWPRHHHTVFYCNALAIFCLSHIPTWSLIRLPDYLTTCLTGTFNHKKRFYLSLVFAPIPQCRFCLKNTLQSFSELNWTEEMTSMGTATTTYSTYYVHCT